MLCGEAVAADGGTKIIIVDENDKAFNAETVRWWYSGKRNNKVELLCVNQQCDERLLRDGWVAPIIISANATVVEPDDAFCWKLYHGEVSLGAPKKEIKIVLRYKNKICK